MRRKDQVGGGASAILVALSLAGSGWAGEGPRIVLDPGHGGALEGAVAPSGLREKELALKMALAIRRALEKELAAKVSLTRQDDSLVHLNERVAFINRERPDLFISIHANSMPTKRQRRRTHGIETFFLSAYASDAEAGKTADRENAESPRGLAQSADPLQMILSDLERTEAQVDSSRLAYAVHQALIESTGAEDRGVQQAPFYVLMGIDVPAVLVEVGFISHPAESRRLEDPRYQQTLAEAIARGVRNFVRQTESRDGPRAYLQRPSSRISRSP